MPARVSWCDPGHIILYTVCDPLTLEELHTASAEVWTLAEGVPDVVDMIFDYRAVSEFPRGGLPAVRAGSFALPTLDRVALVGNEPLVEMMVIELMHTTYRPNPTIHADVDQAAAYLRRMAAEDANRG